MERLTPALMARAGVSLVAAASAEVEVLEDAVSVVVVVAAAAVVVAAADATEMTEATDA